MALNPHLPALADFPDHSAKSREQIPLTIAHTEELKLQIEGHREALLKAEAALQAAEPLTAGFEVAMRKADEKRRLLAAAEYGAHIAKVADLRSNLATAKASAESAIAELESQIQSNDGYLKALELDVVNGEARNAVALYEARLNYANLVAVSRYTLDKLFKAGIYSRDHAKYPLLLDPSASTEVGPFSIAISGAYERFDDAYAPKPTPAPDEKFNAMWQEIES